MNTWNGEQNTRPEMGEEFSYKGKQYKVDLCPCRNHCGRPSVFDLETQKEVEHLTIRYRGDSEEAQGKADVIVVMQGRKWTASELADKLENGEKFVDLAQALLDDMEKEVVENRKTPNEVIAEYGIDEYLLGRMLGLI